MFDVLKRSTSIDFAKIKAGVLTTYRRWGLGPVSSHIEMHRGGDPPRANVFSCCCGGVSPLGTSKTRAAAAGG